MSDQVENIQPVETFIGGCPDPTSGRAIIIPGGPPTTVDYQFRDSKGNALDLSDYRVNPNGAIAYFADIFCPMATVHTATCTIPEGKTGKVNIQVPAAVTQAPGIYTVEIWIVTDKDDPMATAVYRESTIASVETSLMLKAVSKVFTPGPLTISEIRMQLRDYPALNEFWNQHEFSVAEIVNSIIQPIYVWNETPPAVATYTGANFPYRNKWLEATTANLMRTASAWLLRNARTIKYADNTTESDKDKFAEYLRIAETKWQTYIDFCRAQKYAINLRSGPGIHGI